MEYVVRRRLSLGSLFGSGVAKPGPTQAWARASESGKQLNIVLSYSIAICNDAASYALLTSLFGRLMFNTILVKTCTARMYAGSELLPTTPDSRQTAFQKWSQEQSE